MVHDTLVKVAALICDALSSATFLFRLPDITVQRCACLYEQLFSTPKRSPLSR